MGQSLSLNFMFGWSYLKNMEAYVIQKAGSLITLSYIRSDGREIDLMYDGSSYILVIDGEQKRRIKKDSTDKDELLEAYQMEHAFNLLNIDARCGISRVDALINIT